MTAIEIVGYIVSILLLISRFLQSAKPIWGRLPKVVAVLIPGVVSLIPQIIETLNQTKTWSDLANYLMASAAIVAVGLFPKHERTEAPETWQSSGSGGTGNHERSYHEPHRTNDPPPPTGSF